MSIVDRVASLKTSTVKGQELKLYSGEILKVSEVRETSCRIGIYNYTWIELERAIRVGALTKIEHEKAKTAKA